MGQTQPDNEMEQMMEIRADAEDIADIIVLSVEFRWYICFVIIGCGIARALNHYLCLLRKMLGRGENLGYG